MGVLLQPYALGAPPFTSPLDLSGLALWLEADAITGLVNNDPVTTWADASGNARDAAQATGAAKPLYKTGIINGKPVLRFDGSDDKLLCAATLVTYRHLFFVSSHAGATFANYNGLITGQTAAGAGIVAIAEGLTARFSETAGDVGGTGVAWHVNGTAFGPSAAPAPMNSVPSVVSVSRSGGWSIGVQIGQDRTNGGRFWNGDIAAIVAYDRVLTDVERGQMQGYLGAKYGITIA